MIDPETHFEWLWNEIQLKLSTEQYFHTYNLRSKNRSFSEGQAVYVRNFVQSDKVNKFSAKLASKFLKAHFEKIGRVAYKCVDEKGSSIGVYHVKDIRDQGFICRHETIQGHRASQRFATDIVYKVLLKSTYIKYTKIVMNPKI